ncbi:MAG: acyl-CoA dehydrogenase family protein [Solirubrobacterales bacterium]
MASADAGPRFPQPPLREAFPRLRQLERRDRGYVRRLERLQLQARGFADRRLRAVALETDRRAGADPSRLDWELVRAGGAAGMLDLLVPAELGGRGCLTAEVAVAMEELCAACPGLALIFGAHALGISPLLFAGPLHWDVLGEVAESARSPAPMLMACALTEPDAGTDVENLDLLAVARISSRARPVPGGYSLSGTKRFISNGSVARWLTVLMPVDPRRPVETWSCFLVDARSPGFSVARVEHKMGQRACPAAELTFDEVFVPTERLVGRVGDGGGTTLTVLAASRPAVGAIAVGIARGSFERLLGWLRASVEGRRLLDRQAVQLRLAAIAERLHLARQAYFDAAVEFDRALGTASRHPLMRALRVVPNRVHRHPRLRGLASAPASRDALAGLLSRTSSDAAMSRALGLSSLAKASCADVAMSVTHEALEIAGLTDAPVRAELEKLWRDAKLCQIYEGTNQLNRVEVYRALVAGETAPVLPPRRRQVELAGAGG